VGVRPPVPPNAPTRSLRSVSMVMSSTLQPRQSAWLSGAGRVLQPARVAATMQPTASIRPIVDRIRSHYPPDASCAGSRQIFAFADTSCQFLGSHPAPTGISARPKEVNSMSRFDFDANVANSANEHGVCLTEFAPRRQSHFHLLVRGLKEEGAFMR